MLLSFPNMHMKVTGDSFSMKKKKVSVVVSPCVVPCVFVLVTRQGVDLQTHQDLGAPFSICAVFYVLHVACVILFISSNYKSTTRQRPVLMFSTSLCLVLEQFIMLRDWLQPHLYRILYLP